MGKYIRNRLLMMVILLLGMTFIVFASLYIAPGDPAELAAGPSATISGSISRSLFSMEDTFGIFFMEIWVPPT